MENIERIDSETTSVAQETTPVAQEATSVAQVAADSQGDAMAEAENSVNEQENIMKFTCGTVYSVLHNEDAPPFAGLITEAVGDVPITDGTLSDDMQGLVLVADGLGGAGATKHNVTMDQSNISLLDDLLEDTEALPASYKDDLKEAMIDGVPDTSALWGSRIAASQYIKYLKGSLFQRKRKLSDPTAGQEIADIICWNLDRIAKAFGLTANRRLKQLVLPTTLATISFHTEKGNVIAETVWAGDSRCYALTKDGLIPLSKDDEAPNGGITNLFKAKGADEDRSYNENDRTPNPCGRVKLNYRKRTLSAPCILLTVSDGIFDPFGEHGHLGVEAMLMSIIEESDSWYGFETKLKKLYDTYYHHDDATVAYAAVGFDSFSAAKEIFKDRADKIVKLWDDVVANKKALLFLQDSSVYDHAYNYVCTRTKDKFSRIVDTLAGEFICERDRRSHVRDIALTDDIRENFGATFKRVRNNRSLCTEKGKRNAEAIHKIKEEIDQNPERLLDWFVWNRKKKSNMKELFQKAEEIVKCKEKMKSLQNDIERLKSELKEDVAAWPKALASDLTQDNVNDMAYEQMETFYSNLDNRYGESKRKRNELKAKQDEYAAAAVKCDKLCEEFREMWKNWPDKLTGWKNRHYQLRDKLTEEGCRAVGLDYAEEERAELIRGIEGEEAFRAQIVQALGNSPKDTSVIDTYYNVASLRDFRLYSDFKKNMSPEIVALKEALNRELDRYKALEEEN